MRYLNHVADKFDLRRDIQFHASVASAYYREPTHHWDVTLENGERLCARFLVTALGPLSAPTLPRIPGIDSFQGQSCHTARWPHEKMDFAGKRVAVIGTGATGIQTIQEVAKTCGHLTVLQRTPNWSTPLHDSPIDAEEMTKLRAGYDDMFQRCRETFACFLHTADPRNTFDVTEETRQAFWEELYASPGFGIWIGNFRDILTDRAANAAISAFVADKIRGRVKNQVIAEKLIPKNHGFGTRRVPMETGYFEVYNQNNVTLVDLTETPIERITETGIKTRDAERDFDIIIYATGFDAITGAFDRIDIRGSNGIVLKDRWKAGPETYLGMTVDGFPNMAMLVGPHMALGNIPRTIAYNVEWVANLLRYARDHHITRFEANSADVQSWTAHVKSLAEGNLMFEVNSWMTGINTNIDGKNVRMVSRYSGSAPDWRAKCSAVADSAYVGMTLQT